MKGFQIAIDGPVAAGKSTVAKMLAERLGFLYVDTGAMYRCVALRAKRLGIDWNDEERVTELMSTISIELCKPRNEEKDGRQVTVLLEDNDVSSEIRSSEIGEGASIVSTYVGVREALVELQRNLADDENVVMEGRDIGTRVLPRAQLKVYMDASVDERVNRKWIFIKERGEDISKEKVKEDLMRRDDREMGRAIDPLRPAKDAWVFDTTGLTIEQVVGRIESEVNKRKLF
jgi:cytidylate kinase